MLGHKYVLGKVENIVRKEEKDDYQHFPLFQQRFQMAYF